MKNNYLTLEVLCWQSPFRARSSFFHFRRWFPATPPQTRELLLRLLLKPLVGLILLCRPRALHNLLRRGTFWKLIIQPHRQQQKERSFICWFYSQQKDCQWPPILLLLPQPEQKHAISTSRSLYSKFWGKSAYNFEQKRGDRQLLVGYLLNQSN